MVLCYKLRLSEGASASNASSPGSRARARRYTVKIVPSVSRGAHGRSYDVQIREDVRFYSTAIVKHSAAAASLSARHRGGGDRGRDGTAVDHGLAPIFPVLGGNAGEKGCCNPDREYTTGASPRKASTAPSAYRRPRGSAAPPWPRCRRRSPDGGAADHFTTSSVRLEIFDIRAGGAWAP